MAKRRRVRKWRLRDVPNLTACGEPALGVCDFNKREIRVDPDQPAQQYLETVVHECLHAAYPGGAVWGEGTWGEEAFIRAIEKRLTRVLQEVGLLSRSP